MQVKCQIVINFYHFNFNASKLIFLNKGAELLNAFPYFQSNCPQNRGFISKNNISNPFPNHSPRKRQNRPGKKSNQPDRMSTSSQKLRKCKWNLNPFELGKKRLIFSVLRVPPPTRWKTLSRKLLHHRRASLIHFSPPRLDTFECSPFINAISSYSLPSLKPKG